MSSTRHPTMTELSLRIRGEFMEMPGLRLTREQACRLWGLDTQTCQRLLFTLVTARFLAEAPDGRYRRAE